MLRGISYIVLSFYISQRTVNHRRQVQLSRRRVYASKVAGYTSTILRKYFEDQVNIRGPLRFRKYPTIMLQSLLNHQPRSLGAVIMLTLSWLNTELRFFVPDVDSLQSLAIDNLSRWNVSSISDVLAILEEIRRKTRLRSRV